MAVATTLQHVLKTKGRRLSRSCSISKFTRKNGETPQWLAKLEEANRDE
jgi:hypothetical protein